MTKALLEEEFGSDRLERFLEMNNDLSAGQFVDTLLTEYRAGPIAPSARIPRITSLC
jgi:hypothetical protein